MLRIVSLIVLFLYSSILVGQVGINTTSPDPSALLDVQSTSQGILVPRMTSGERDAITSPANGLLIYNTDSDEFQFNSNSAATPIWQALDNKPTSSSTIGQSIKYSNTDITTDVNQNNAINAPLLGTEEWNDNTTLYDVNTSTHEITIAETGRYKIVVNASVEVSGNRTRVAPEMRLTVNGTQEGSYASTGYIRRSSGHNESSLHLTEIIEVTAGDVIAVDILRAGNSSTATITVNFRDTGTANIYIEKLM